MSVIFTDAFTRADSTALGANWTELSGDSQILTNRLRLPAPPGSNPMSATTTTSAHAAIADCKVQVTQVSVSGDGGPIARVVNNLNLYAVDVYTGRCELYRHDNTGSGTLLGSGVSITQVANGVIGLEVSGAGATVTVKSYYQGVLKETVGDASANRITTARQTGVYNWASAANADYDDFSVDDLVVAGGIAIPVLTRQYRQRWS